MFRDSSDVEIERDVPMPINNVSDGDGDGDTLSLSSTRDSEENQHPLAHDSQQVYPFDSDEEEEDLFRARLSAVHERIHFLENTRVLFPNKVHKLLQLHLILVSYKEEDPKRFCRNLRVSPETFDGILDIFDGHPIFYNGSNQPQMAVERQLAIGLFRFGHYGNAVSVESVAQWAGCSAGMVVKATRRIIQAVLTFHDQFVHWPGAEEKEAAKEWVEAASCAAWRDGWVFVDGTLVPLADKPGHHGEAYFDRKHNYSLNVQVCFFFKHITYFIHC